MSLSLKIILRAFEGYK